MPRKIISVGATGIDVLERSGFPRLVAQGQASIRRASILTGRTTERWAFRFLRNSSVRRAAWRLDEELEMSVARQLGAKRRSGAGAILVALGRHRCRNRMAANAQLGNTKQKVEVEYVH